MKYALFIIVAGGAFLIGLLLNVPWVNVLSLINLALIIFLAEWIGNILYILNKTKTIGRSNDTTRNVGES